MKSHEFLKAAADFFGGVGTPTVTPQQPNQANLSPAEVQTGENPDVNTKPMVGPLQQKLELLKKAVDVDNMYDNPEIAGGEDQEEPADELDDMKRLAGIMVLGGDDEPFEA
jgi:hypothetical protein